MRETARRGGERERNRVWVAKQSVSSVARYASQPLVPVTFDKKGRLRDEDFERREKKRRPPSLRRYRRRRGDGWCIKAGNAMDAL
jgi:hypothetical protein